MCEEKKESSQARAWWREGPIGVLTEGSQKMRHLIGPFLKLHLYRMYNFMSIFLLNLIFQTFSRIKYSWKARFFRTV